MNILQTAVNRNPGDSGREAETLLKPAVECRNLSAGYRKPVREGTCILHDLTFTVREGESAALLGQNGCGKTTLLRTLTGLLPYRGEIRLCGENLSGLNRRGIAERTAMLTQFSEVYFSYTIRETVEMGRYIRGTRSAYDREKIDECLEMTGLADLQNRQISGLSGGQLQRVFLARTLAQETPVIFLDEPMNHLDLKYQIRLREYLAKWSEGSTALPGGQVYRNTLIGVYHDVTMAAEMADHLIFLKNGRIAAEGGRDEVFRRDILESVYDVDVASHLHREQEIQNRFLFGGGKTRKEPEL